LSLLGLLHCIWGAQFIGIGVEFAPLIFNRSVHPSPAKLRLSDWPAVQLATQEAPLRLGDMICMFNLGN